MSSNTETLDAGRATQPQPTPTTFVDWTPKQVYERLVLATNDGTFPSIEPNHGVCKYRQGKCRCAFGLFIPDDIYCEEMEQTSVVSMFDKRLWYNHAPKFQQIEDKIDKLKSVLPSWSHASFWQSIQGCHDASVNISGDRIVEWNKQAFILHIEEVFSRYAFSII